MIYTADQIVKRAYNLADIKDTDFISHEETTQYLNDSYTEVVNSIIDKGDKQFVREVVLSGNGYGPFTEYEMPDDLYIIHSMKTAQGSLIPRAPVGSGECDGSYEIINNKIRLYGTSYGNIIMTYWVKPCYITYPDKDITIPYASGDIISSASDSVLLSDGTIYNVVTGDVIAKLTLDTDNYDYYLGNGHYVEDPKNGSTVSWKDYLGATIDSVTFVGGTFPDHYFIYDSNYNVVMSVEANDDSQLLSIGNRQICAIPAGYKTLAVYSDKVLLLKDLGDGTFIYAVYDKRSKSVIETDDKVQMFKDNIDAVPVPNFDNLNSALHNGALIIINRDYSVDVEELDIPALYYFKYLKYGVVCSNGTDFYVMSRYPDTEFNFPNEVLYSLVAANLGLKLLAKQNADSSGLKELYQNMYNVYCDSLSQDASYLTVRNAYI